MFRKLIRKKHFRTLLAQLRGAKKLKERGTPFFVVDTVTSLPDVPFDLKENDFPKILVGTHGRIAEILMRQNLLKNRNIICSAVMQSIGSGKPLSIPLPSAWRKYLADNGVPFSASNCKVLLFLSSLRQIAVGFVKSLILLSPFKKPRYPGCPYVVFINLYQQNLPIPGGKKSYDLISWYKESTIRKPGIGKIWAQAKVGKEYVAPDDLVVAPSMFPKLGSFSGYVRFIFSNTLALFVAAFGVFMGKWWYGFLYHESVFYNYLCSLTTDQLADDYFFSISSWLYKPLWAHEVEQKGSSVILYCYSVNMIEIQRSGDEVPDCYGWNILLWNQFIVWDQQQEDYFKQYCPHGTYIQVGSLDTIGIEYKTISSKRKKIISVFDVIPGRPTFYTSRGYAIPNYYSEELNLEFFSTIINIFNDDDWEILWKQKRDVPAFFCSNRFKEKQKNLMFGSIAKVDTNVSARSLIKVSDAVISMPFTSTSLIAKELGVSTIFYDASGKIQEKRNHDISVLRNKNELLQWKLSLKKLNSEFSLEKLNNTDLRSTNYN